MSGSGSAERRRRGHRRGEERRLRAIVDHVADGIVIVGEDGIIRFVNPAAAKLFGRTPEELVGLPFGVPLFADEREEIDLLRKDGSTAVAEIRAVEMDWEDEPSLLISLRDNTERREAEERLHQLSLEQAARMRAELEERRSRFLAEASTLFDTSMDGSAILSRLARLCVSAGAELSALAGNGPSLRLADWCAIDAVDEDGAVKPVAITHHDSAKASIIAELRRIFDPGEPRPFLALPALESSEPLLRTEVSDELLERLAGNPEQAALLRRLGTASLIALPLIARGATLGALTLGRGGGRPFDEADLALARDLAQRAALAVANARLYAQAEEANRAKSDFLAVMSHELRTPLNAIMGYTDLLRAEIVGPLTDKQRDHLERIGASSRHLLQIVDEILTFARMEAGREQLNLESVDLAQIVEDADAMVRPLVERKGLSLRTQITETPLRLTTEPGKVRQILLNLLSNAAKFTDEGEVVLSARMDGDRFLVDVRDTGVGIAEEHLERIFEPFWQVEQTARRTAGGTGLGLSVAHRLAKILGGDLRVRSTIGKGTEFTLELPSATVARSELPASP